jgi:hypothetical protein
MEDGAAFGGGVCSGVGWRLAGREKGGGEQRAKGQRLWAGV